MHTSIPSHQKLYANKSTLEDNSCFSEKSKNRRTCMYVLQYCFNSIIFDVFQKAKAMELLLSQTINTLPKRDPDPEIYTQIQSFKQTQTDPLISQEISYHQTRTSQKRKGAPKQMKKRKKDDKLII
jgi:hypothetical protein